jgi:L-idonate 5-dehydrogenase
VALISSRRVDVRPIVTGTFPVEAVHAAFKSAGDRSASVKVQLAFD